MSSCDGRRDRQAVSSSIALQHRSAILTHNTNEHLPTRREKPLCLSLWTGCNNDRLPSMDEAFLPGIHNREQEAQLLQRDHVTFGAGSNYIRQVNGVKLAEIMFSLLCVCAHSVPLVWMDWMLRNIFDSCVKNFRTDNISLETSFYWLSDDVVRFEIEVGVEEKCTKNNTYITQNGFSAHATARRKAMSADDVIIVGRRLLRTYITRDARM